MYGLAAIASALGSSTIANVKVVEGEGWTVDDQRPATPGYKKKKFNEAMQSIGNVIEYLGVDVVTQKLEMMKKLITLLMKGKRHIMERLLVLIILRQLMGA